MKLTQLIAQYVAFRKSLGQDLKVIGGVWLPSPVLSDKVRRSTL